MLNWSFCNLIGDNRFSVILHKSLILGRPDPLRVLPRGCGYARLPLSQVHDYLKVTIIYGDNILRIGGIAHFARIKFCDYAACASGVALLFHAHAHKKTA